MSKLSIALGRITRPLTDRLVYTARTGVALGMKRRGGLGWLPRPISDEEQYVLDIDVHGKVVYDIGAFEGLFTIRFARDARQVVTFEPHPWCQATTAENVRLNGLTNVTLVPVALSDRAGLMPLAYPVREPARSTIDPALADTLTAQGYRMRRTSVLCWRLDDAVTALRLPAPDLVKIDAEGAEALILRGAERTIAEHQPDLYIELHNTRAEVMPILKEYGYTPNMVDELHVRASPAARADGNRSPARRIQLTPEGHTPASSSHR